GNALELKLCKIPTIGTQSENQTLPTGNISLGSPIVFSGWALHSYLNSVIVIIIFLGSCPGFNSFAVKNGLMNNFVLLQANNANFSMSLVGLTNALA
ncbi:hypothetical protein, partial [Helicobacter pylori]|uniref:hypothetical protein n=1 Tax=Helicobacter pylori TaxID=210 RepID=UPI000EB36D0B